MENKNLNKNLKKYLSLSLGVINVLSPIAIATLTGNLISSAVNASAGSESESQYEIVELPGGDAVIKLNKAKRVFCFLNGINEVGPEDFGDGGLRLELNRDGRADLWFERDGEKYKYSWKEIHYYFDDEKDDPCSLDLSDMTFSIWSEEKKEEEEIGTITVDGVNFRSRSLNFKESKRPSLTVKFNLNGGTYKGKDFIVPQKFIAEPKGYGFVSICDITLPSEDIVGPNGEKFIGWTDERGNKFGSRYYHHCSFNPSDGHSSRVEAVLFARYEK